MPTPEELRAAAERMDWQQVVLNGGPPCFHLEGDGRFCGRAERWEGHPEIHSYVPLASLLQLTSGQPTREELLSENARLKSLLTEIEWSGEFGCCPICGLDNKDNEEQHSPDCRLVAALGGKLAGTEGGD